MGHALTVKGQVTIPKAMREHMGVVQGQELEFVPQPNGQVLMYPAKRVQDDENPFRRYVGTGVAGMTTKQILDETRGEGWDR